MIGTTRKVWIYPDYVVKEARNRIGVIINQREVETFLSIPSPYLCPILAYSNDYRSIKMKRVKIPSLRIRLRYARHLRKVLKPYRLQDIRWYNIGEIGNQPVLYDYGGLWLSLCVLKDLKHKVYKD